MSSRNVTTVSPDPSLSLSSAESSRSGETRGSHPEPERRRSAQKRVPPIPITELRVKDTHRLIASRYSETGTVLSRLSSNSATLTNLLELDEATNDRFRGEEGLLPGIGIHELVYGIRYAHIVNAAFTHASPSGGRFNTPTRGAWYASLELSTSVAEIAFHKLRQLEEIDWQQEEVSTSDDYLADVTSPFHDLRDLPGAEIGDPARTPAGSSLPSATLANFELSEPSGDLQSGQASSATEAPSSMVEPSSLPSPDAHTNPFARYLRPDPIPRCYLRPQRLADRLLAKRSNGIIYPSVRQPEGTCLAIFRPALVYNVRRGPRLELSLHSNRSFDASQVREVPIPKA